MNKILVPTDFSPTARNAIAYAIRLAAKSNSGLIIFHANDPGLKREETDVEAAMETLKKSVLSGLNSPTHIEFVYENGSLPEALPGAAKKYKADMVLMGTNGVSGSNSFRVGSNAYAVVEECPVPVMVVPPQANFDGITKTVIALDFKSDFDELPLLALMKVLQMTGGEVYVLSVLSSTAVNKPEAMMDVQKISSVLKNNPHSFHYVYSDNIEKGIDDFCSLHYADVIITFPKKHAWVKKMFNTTYTQNLVYHIKTPVIAIHE